MANANQDENENEGEFTSIKSSLNAILRPQYANYVKDMIFDRARRITEISSLATLLLLHKVNSAVDSMSVNFFLQNGTKVIYDCFDAVTEEHIYEERMPPEFRIQMENLHDQYQWPSKSHLGNSFQYFRQQYVTNLKTNLNTHCENILKGFLKIRVFQLNLHNPVVPYDAIDIRNALKDVMKDMDWTDGDALRQEKKQHLLQHLTDIGFPADTNLKQYVKSNWFQTIWPFIRIQREVEQFLIDYRDQMEQWRVFNKDRKSNEKPDKPRPPTVRNFTVIPLCDSHLKHIKIDISDCYQWTSKCDAIPKFTNEKTGKLNKYPKGYYTSKKLSREVKNERAAELFDTLFNMDKIRRNGKHAKEFHGQINTDGVAASVLYDRPKRSNRFFCLLMIYMKYIFGFFVNVIGIDPGDKTWLAGIRREIRTDVEVSNKNLFEAITSNTHL